MRHSLMAGFVLAGALLAPTGGQAHFQMLAPTGWLIEDRLGDPQKMAPCGGTTAIRARPATP